MHWILRIARCLLACAERQRQRRHLAELEPHLLRDIGRTPAEARREARKAFWRR